MRLLEAPTQVPPDAAVFFDDSVQVVVCEDSMKEKVSEHVGGRLDAVGSEYFGG